MMNKTLSVRLKDDQTQVFIPRRLDFHIPFYQKAPAVSIKINVLGPTKYAKVPEVVETAFNAFLIAVFDSSVTEDQRSTALKNTVASKLPDLIAVTYPAQFHSPKHFMPLVSFLFLAYYVDDKNEETDHSARRSDVIAILKNQACKATSNSAKIARLFMANFQDHLSTLGVTPEMYSRLSKHWIDSFDSQMQSTELERHNTNPNKRSSLEGYLDEQQEIVGAKPFFELYFFFLSIQTPSFFPHHEQINEKCSELITLSCEAIRLINDCVSFWKELKKSIQIQVKELTIEPYIADINPYKETFLSLESRLSLRIPNFTLPENAVFICSFRNNCTIAEAFQLLADGYNDRLSRLEKIGLGLIQNYQDENHPQFSLIETYIHHIMNWPSGTAQWSLISGRYQHKDSLSTTPP